MSRASGAYLGESAGEQVAPILLVRFIDLPDRTTPATTYSHYFTDAEETISFFDEGGSAEAYLPIGVKVEDITADQTQEVKSFRIHLDNVGRDFCTLVSTIQPLGCEVHVLRAFRDDLSSADCAQMVVAGRINSWQVNEGEIEVECIIPISLEQRVPRRLFWPMCNWQFKSAACGYSGTATSCARTLAACQALSNKARFGGFPHLLRSRDPRNVWTKV